MIEFLNNPWTIGIGGGLISGIIVFLITNKFFSRKENKEYLQNLRIANKELLYAVRPLIVGQKLPNEEILDSIIYSTAKKYNVKYYDLYSSDDIADDLIKEILDNPFLDSDNKLKYCELTEKLKELSSSDIDTEEPKREIVYLEKEKSISSEFISLTLGLVTTMSIVITVLYILKDGEAINIMQIIVMLTLIPVLALMISTFLKYIKRREKEREMLKGDNIDSKGEEILKEKEIKDLKK